MWRPETADLSIFRSPENVETGDRRPETGDRRLLYIYILE